MVALRSLLLRRIPGPGVLLPRLVVGPAARGGAPTTRPPAIPRRFMGTARQEGEEGFIRAAQIRVDELRRTADNLRKLRIATECAFLGHPLLLIRVAAPVVDP